VDGRRASTPPATALLLPQIKQVAVLPFQVIGSAENTRTVADGLVEILAAALSDFEHFQGTITAGSAQPAGENIEFALNLVDAVTLRQIGAKTFVYDVRNPVGQINPHIRPIVMPALS
jgi:hypothetical protein